MNRRIHLSFVVALALCNMANAVSIQSLDYSVSKVRLTDMLKNELSTFIDHPLIGAYDIDVQVIQYPKQAGWSPTVTSHFTQKSVIDWDDGIYSIGIYDHKTYRRIIPLGETNIATFLSGHMSQIGSSNSYNYSRLTDGSKDQRVTVDNPWSFRIRCMLSQEEIKGLFGNYNGTDVVIQADFVREYPTYEQLASSIEAEQNKQAEETVPTEWSGTCIAIGRDMVATNYHVVEDAKSLTVLNKESNANTEYTAQVILTDKFNDLAVLKITDSRFKGFDIKYGLKYDVADIGTDIFVLGYPLIETMGEDIKLTTGVISAKTGFQGDVSQYQISAAVQPGNSGGPLFDNKGNLIGIVSSKHRGTENVGYAIKLSYLRNLVESAYTPINLTSTNSISAFSLSEKIKRITPCVMIVKAKK